ncbi:hypothetical protein V6Z11_D10G213400 [Gossypium hirsutum]
MLRNWVNPNGVAALLTQFQLLLQFPPNNLFSGASSHLKPSFKECVGAHPIGLATCALFRSRIRNDSQH